MTSSARCRSAGSRPSRWSSRRMPLPAQGPAAALRTGQRGALRDLRVGRSHGGLRRGRRHLEGRREGDGERAQRAAAGAAAARRLEELRAEDRRRPRRRRDDHRHQDGRVADAPRARRKDHDPVAGAGDLRPGRQALSRPPAASRSRSSSAARRERTRWRGAPLPPAGGAGVENVVGGSIRPIHARGSMGGEAGVAFLRSAGFKATVVTPPLALAVLVLFGRARERLGRDSHRTRRRRMRTMARRRLRAAEAHRAAGRAGDFYGEIDRVLREALSERLGTELGGLRFDELGALLARARPAGRADRQRGRRHSSLRRGAVRARRGGGRSGGARRDAGARRVADRRHRAGRRSARRPAREAPGARRDAGPGGARAARAADGGLGARRPARRGLAARQRGLPARRLRRRRRRPTRSSSTRGSSRRISSSIWATPTSARGRWGRRSGPSKRPPRSIPATRTRATTSARRARWPRARRTTGSRGRIAIRSGSAPSPRWGPRPRPGCS